MTKKSNKCRGIIFTRNNYTEEQNEYHRILQTKMLYFKKYQFKL